MESCSQRRWDGFTAVTVIERDWMGLWGRKVCDNLASKRDTESIPSQSSRTEITGLDQETHKTWDHSFHISARAPEFSCRESDKTLLLSEMSEIQYTVVPDIHTPCIYFRILQFYSSQDINNKKNQFCELQGHFLYYDAKTSALGSNSISTPSLTVVTLSATGRVELNWTGNGTLL